MDRAERVYAYAKKSVANRPNSPWPWPSIRQTARALRMRQADVIDAVEDAAAIGLPCLLIVGIQTAAGCGSYEKEGDYEIEVWEE